MIIKMIRMAERLGLDPEELFEMNFFEALLKMEETQEMWREVKSIGK